MATVTWFGDGHGEFSISSLGAAVLLEVEDRRRVIRSIRLGHSFSRFGPPVSAGLNPTLAVDDEAQAWFTRVQDGDCTESDWLAFTAWLEADTSHRQAYATQEDRWIALEAGASPASPQPANILSLQNLKGIQSTEGETIRPEIGDGALYFVRDH